MLHDEPTQDEVFTSPNPPSDENPTEHHSMEQLAFSSPSERLHFMLQLMRGLVLRYIRRHGARVFDDDGKIDFHGVSIREVLLNTGAIGQADKEDEWLDRLGFVPLEHVENHLAWFRGFIQQRLEANDALEKLDILMPERIQAEFQLTDDELLLLCAVAAPQIDHDVLRL